jgi:hypothetical protein
VVAEEVKVLQLDHCHPLVQKEEMVDLEEDLQDLTQHLTVLVVLVYVVKEILVDLVHLVLDQVLPLVEEEQGAQEVIEQQEQEVLVVMVQTYHLYIQE